MLLCQSTQAAARRLQLHSAVQLYQPSDPHTTDPAAKPRCNACKGASGMAEAAAQASGLRLSEFGLLYRLLYALWAPYSSIGS